MATRKILSAHGGFLCHKITGATSFSGYFPDAAAVTAADLTANVVTFNETESNLGLFRHLGSHFAVSGSSGEQRVAIVVCAHIVVPVDLDWTLALTNGLADGNELNTVDDPALDCVLATGTGPGFEELQVPVSHAHCIRFTTSVAGAPFTGFVKLYIHVNTDTGGTWNM